MSVDATGAVAASVTGAIRQAAQKTGANFDYLLATARVESNLNPNARAPSSTAGGLFQFIEQTWLGTLKQAGPSFGYGRYADAITVSPAGTFEVQNPILRQQILNLRNDPAANALMAGALTKSNGELLAARIGRNPSEGELYLAHFLGVAGASTLIKQASVSPQANAAALFPRAADANHSIFYTKQGEPRSVAQVYHTMVGRYDVARAQSPGGPQHAVAVRTVPAPLAVAAMAAPIPASMTDLVSGPRPAVPLVAPLINTEESGPMFYGLFRTSDRREAVAPVVSALWGTATPAPTSANAPKSEQNHGPHGGLLDLFRDQG